MKNNYASFIQKAANFIDADLKSKNETRISSIKFVMGIAQMKVKTSEGKNKTVRYSAASDTLAGYRKIIFS